MSSDLLAEFDPFYKASAANSSSDQRNVPSTSAINDLSFFGSPSPNVTSPPASQAHWVANAPKPMSNNDIMGGMNNLHSGNGQRQGLEQDSDIWGDFEDAPVTKFSPEIPARISAMVTTSFDKTPLAISRTTADLVKPGIVRASTDELFSSNIADLAESSALHSRSKSAINRTINQPSLRNLTSPPVEGDILFDADELEDEDDDFGDFETVTSEPPESISFAGRPPGALPAPRRPIGLTMGTPALKAYPYPYPQAPKSPSFQERNPFGDLALSATVATSKDSDPKSKSPVTAWPVYEPPQPAGIPFSDSSTTIITKEDDWDDSFGVPTDMYPGRSKSTKTPAKSSPKPSTEKPDLRPGLNGLNEILAMVDDTSTTYRDDDWGWDTVDGSSNQASAPSTDGIPPTNIPPPSVLLSIFPQLFNLPRTSLFQPVANQTYSLKNRIMSDPSTINFLRAYILIATVAARIIAGRKLRWKRDNILSQAMKMGPASASGKGGMKLSGVDKAENTREEREAAELVRVWKEQVGRLRSAIAVANPSIRDQSQHLVVPEIMEVMPVKADGRITSARPCVLCGLKRDERISKVDIQVEDSFGEWWVEYWGHRACRNFWQEHESKLKQR